MVLVGCFDSLGEKKEKLLGGFPHLVSRLGRREKGSPLSRDERIALQMSILGFSFTGHPLTLFKGILQGRIKSNKLAKVPEGGKVRLAGQKIILHTPPTKSGKRVIFLTLEDEEGLIDAVLFPSVQERFARSIYEADFLLLEGYIKKHGSVTSIVVEKASDLQRML